MHLSFTLSPSQQSGIEDAAQIAPQRFTLDAQQVAHLFNPSHGLLKVLAGRIWLTQQGEAEDVWLTAGDSLRLAPRTHYYLSAEPTAQFEVERLPAPPYSRLRWSFS